MNERISQLMDGELEDAAAEQVIQALGRDGEALQTWRVYHLISDALRENQPLPRAPLVPLQPRRWVALPVAASLAAVALVGWLAFSPQQGTTPQALVAEVPVTAPAPAKPSVLRVPLPRATSDYLLAHQGVSPRGSLQGMAPYVRMVSDQAQEARR
ncbi:MAG TPA: sigma-E factor negative regulatory protein [Burkholderiales bacterium]|nr:sigma-E factor negative regulatory protein [Burkholderiales bacterium]